MKRLPIVITMVVAGSFLAFQTMGTTGKTNPPSKYEEILKLVVQKLTEDHYDPQKIDDAFSKKVFKKYLNQLDADKTYFLQSDIDLLKKKYEIHIDDEMKGAPVEFFLESGKIFNTRMEESAKFCSEILSKPFDFSIDEEANLDGTRLNYTVTNSERKERWRKRLKYLALQRYSDLLDVREKNKGVEGFVVKTDEELEQDAREKVKKIMDRTFDHYRYKSSDDDKFNLFVNAITTTMDPHTEYFPPVEKRYFDEEMSGRFFGIGASLIANEDGDIKINTIITGSPAWKSGELQVGDIILKVGQGKDEPTDLTGYEVSDAVKIIRGKKGTEVRLTVKKQNGSIKVVSLVRDEIVQDETFARSAIVKNGDEKIGYIYLPEFYADFEHPNGNRCSVDVAKEVIKLKEQKVDGIVIDLRSNGGGSLYDVVQMVGLFVDNGPVVQVKDRENRASVLKDKESGVLYSGPLAVMVNEFSASASEIFAAAIQDYNRGVIIGSTSTYGKGTVQRNIGLGDDGIFSLSNTDLGTIKLTLQKFYRINGGSTQLRGVSSDIVLPDNLEYLKVREKDDPDALSWDEIAKASFTPWKPGYDLKTIEQLSNQRLSNDPSFKIIKNNSEWLAKENDRNYFLQLDKYRKEQQKVNVTVKQNESISRLKDSLNVSPLQGEANRWPNDKDKQQRFNLWIKSLRADIYLDQAVKVMGDMIHQQNLAKAAQTDENKKSF
ncbi:MAG: carboxy terminal-processing peptidase [Bacteroidetes bacterium]|nr:carboxy terminal-processing peptidase [Bacteroidota bacterium]MBS1632792.1 carboxy terminal-processing peptidase [Bacteroidota bacterium]